MVSNPIILFPVRFLTPNREDEPRPKKKPEHYIDYHLTVQTIMGKIKSKFPSSFKSLRESDFVKNSRSFVDSLLSSPEKLSQVLETLPYMCEFCDIPLENWIHKEAKSFLITLGHIREVKVNVKICKSCRRSYYPDFYENGILFVHNKFMLTIEAILDILNNLKNNGSLIETIKDKLTLLGQLEGLCAEYIKRDITNNSVKLEKVVIGVSNLLGKS